jgi:hypothetical protein
MNRIVLDYGDLVRTPATISGLISGTAFFPGGSGLWRGVMADGKLPEFFPQSPIMFVGNYWFNENGFKKALKHGSEEIDQITGFWAAMRAYIRVCGLVEEQCFFTNALMGLTRANGPATGRLTGDGRDFRKQCRAFFDEQVRLVEPKVVVIMGEHAKSHIRHRCE